MEGGTDRRGLGQAGGAGRRCLTLRRAYGTLGCSARCCVTCLFRLCRIGSCWPSGRRPGDRCHSPSCYAPRAVLHRNPATSELSVSSFNYYH